MRPSRLNLLSDQPSLLPFFPPCWSNGCVPRDEWWIVRESSSVRARKRCIWYLSSRLNQKKQRDRSQNINRQLLRQRSRTEVFLRLSRNFRVFGFADSKIAVM